LEAGGRHVHQEHRDGGDSRFEALVTAATSASAQSFISGVVRDATGAVLPGVDVEASNALLDYRRRAPGLRLALPTPSSPTNTTA
jgi:hypothetical protein